MRLQKYWLLNVLKLIEKCFGFFFLLNPTAHHLETLEQREQERVASDLVNPGRLFAHHVAQEVEGRQTTRRLSHALIHLIKKVLRKRPGERDRHFRVFLLLHNHTDFKKGMHGVVHLVIRSGMWTKAVCARTCEREKKHSRGTDRKVITLTTSCMDVMFWLLTYFWSASFSVWV